MTGKGTAGLCPSKEVEIGCEMRRCDPSYIVE